LILVPAAVLILVVLGAVALDAAVVFLGQRQLSAAAANAATDAASAISDSSFYTRGVVELAPQTASAVVRASVASQSLRGVTLDQPIGVEVAGRQVCVTLVGHVNRIFGTAVPGFGAPVEVRARATATAAGDTGQGVPLRRLC
jgi:hypothetical protein